MGEAEDEFGIFHFPGVEHLGEQANAGLGGFRGLGVALFLPAQTGVKFADSRQCVGIGRAPVGMIAGEPALGIETRRHVREHPVMIAVARLVDDIGEDLALGPEGAFLAPG